MEQDHLGDRDLQLLTEGRGLRALARGLLGREDVDDVVQDTFAAALAATASEPRTLRPWLRGTVHKLAALLHRSRARRTAREREVAVSPRDDRCDPATMAAQAELIRDIGAAVHALDEPFRTAVMLRFWHGLPPAAIATELGVPRNTVRSRLQRGLEQLRARLDRRFGDRGRWSAPLLAFAKAPQATVTVSAAGPLLLMGFFMKAKTLVVAIAVLLPALALRLLWSGESLASDPAAAVADVGRQLIPVAENLLLSLPQSAERRREQVLATGSAPGSDRARVHGRCIDESGAALAGCTAKLQCLLPLPGRTNELQAETETGLDGSFVLDLVPAAIAYELRMCGPGRVAMSRRWNELLPGRTHDAGDIVLAVGGGVAGLVRDTRGAAVANVQVRLRRAAQGWSERPPATRPLAPDLVTTGTGGSFASPTPLAAGRWHAYLVPLQGLAGDRVEFDVVAGRITPDVTLICKATTAELRGEVVDEGGVPVGNATIGCASELGAAGIASDAQGRFAMPRLEGDTNEGITLRVSAPGFDPLRTRELAWGEAGVRVVLRRSPVVFVEVVRADDGRPVTEYGLRLVQHPTTAEGVIFSWVTPSLPRPHGLLRIGELPRSRYLAWVEPRAADLAAFLAELTVDAVPSRCQLRAPGASDRTVRVVDARGRTVAGTRLELVQGGHPPAVTLLSAVSPANQLPPYGALLLQRGETDAAGELGLKGPAGAGLALRVLGPGHRPLVVEDVRLDAGLAPLIVRVSTGATVRGRVTPPQVLATFGPSALERRAVATMGERGLLRLQDYEPQVVLRAVGDPGQRFPERPADGAVADDGTFRVDGVPPGSWQACLDFRLPGIARVSGAAIEEPLALITGLRDGEQREVALDCSRLAAGTLQALIVVDGERLAHGKVDLLCRRRGLRWGTVELVEAVIQLETDAEGRLRAELVPGDYAVEVKVQNVAGGVARLRTGQVAAVVSGSTTECRFELQRRSLRVRVLRPDGRPEANRELGVRQERYLLGAGATDEEGRLTIDSVLPGAFELVTWPDGLLEPDPQMAWFRARQHPPWLDGMTRIGPLELPAGVSTAELVLRMPK